MQVLRNKCQLIFGEYSFNLAVASVRSGYGDFMSELMQIFLNDFSVHHIRTGPYLPQSNVACERFNGTLNTTI